MSTPTLSVSITVVLAGLLVLSCADTPRTSVASGKQLAQIYCVSCHSYPQPELLDKRTWREYVMPRMGHMLGLYDAENSRESLMGSGPGRQFVEASDLYPEEPVISPEEFERIADFYNSLAPDSLVVPVSQPDTPLETFSVEAPVLRYSPPSTTLLDIREEAIYLGDAHTRSLSVLDREFRLQRTGNVNEGAVSMESIDDALWITVMGSFSPTDDPSGMILRLPLSGDERPTRIATGLRRPVHTSFGDLDGDGAMDLVVSEFGKWTGRLSLLTNSGDDTWKQTVVLDQPGAVRTSLHDFDRDGLLDIMALFGQGNEAIYILYNKGNMKFEQQMVLQFPASYGSSFFDVMDWDRDGDPDILYTAGDNADYPPLMKPYHGIYIFANDGSNNFEQAFFQHLNGAYGAVAEDFDKDGDTDIAAISFFPDYSTGGREGFLYLRNEGNNVYSRSMLPDPEIGRWIVMESGDVDNDGDTDLLLGSLAFEVIGARGYEERWIAEGVPFLVLRNTTMQ